jgi:outer membrane protein TolC
MLARPLSLALAMSLPVSVALAAQSVEITSHNLKNLLVAENQKVKAMRHEMEASRQREGYLQRSFWPSLGVESSLDSFKNSQTSKIFQPTLGIEIRSNVFNGGKDQIENDIRSLETQRLSLQEQRVAAEEIERARLHYWQILYLTEKIKLLKRSLELNRQNLNSARRRIVSGVATDSDRFEFEMKDVDLKRGIAESELESAAQLRLLRMLLGLNPDANLSLSEPLTHDHDVENVLKQSIKQDEFLYKELEILAEQENLSAETYRRAWWPQVDAFASYKKYNESMESVGPDTPADARSEIALGFKINMELSAKLESDRESVSLLKKVSAYKNLSDYQKNALEAQIKSGIDKIKFLHNQVHDAEENIARATQYYKMTQSEYGRGVKNSPDVLGASERLFDMQHKRLELLRDFQISKARVLSKMGH